MIYAFLLSGEGMPLPPQMMERLENYHVTPFVYDAVELQLTEGGLLDTQSLYVRRKTLLPRGMVAPLLGYKVSKSNKIHSPITTFGPFRSIEEIAQEMWRLLVLFSCPICGTSKIIEKLTQSPDYNDEDVSDLRKGVNTSIVSGNVKTLLVCLVNRRNPKGFLNHPIILNKLWLKRDQPVGIATTQVGQLISEFNFTTSILQHQHDVTSDYSQTMCFLFHFRRFTTENLSHSSEGRRPMNS